MGLSITPETLRTHLPDLHRPVSAPRLQAPVTIYRDAYGIAHVKASGEADAFFGQGFAHAQDRLWHMEADRRRAYGRYAEAIGPAGVAEDTLMRRFGLGRHIPEQYARLAPETRAMLEAYAHGVNAFLEGGDPLPVEFALTGVRPNAWMPYDSLAVFMVRHILMGVWESKLWRVRMMHDVGEEKVAAFHPGYEPGQLVMVPPGGRYGGQVLDGTEALRRHVSHLTFLRHGVDDGSNNWVVSGERTASGRPLLAGDPHRGLDVPNVYYQNHVACGAFDVIGFSFPGVPGFPHFAHSERCAWGITHGSADYQDLYIERFDGGDPPRYEFQGQWEEADHAREEIPVNGAAPVPLETWRTRHGPVVAGNPREGHALAFRYTALQAPNGTMDGIYRMLKARSADELEEAVRPWVDPVNNMVYFDLDGNYGYRTRGQLPVRHADNAWVPVPGWTGEHEWEGTVPFEEMPVVRNPACGYAYTANNRIVDETYPHYIGLDFAPGFRAERINARLKDATGLTVADMAAIHADVTSVPAGAFRPLLARIQPADEAGAQVLAVLRDWDGEVRKEAAGPLVFAALRAAVLRRMFEPQFSAAFLAELFNATDRGANGVLARTQARLHTMIAADDRSLLPPGEDWDSVLAGALDDAVQQLAAALGPDPTVWRWGAVHQTAAFHPLAVRHPAAARLLNPPAIAMHGDGDTVQAAGYYPAQDFHARFISVARYIFDGGDWNNSRWVVPGGVSGHPGSAHYQDQLALHERHETLPMTYDWARIAAEAQATQTLAP